MFAAAHLVPPGSAGTNPWQRILDGPYAAARAAQQQAWTPEQAQRRYDSARDLQLQLPASVTADCVALRRSLASYARAQVAAAESYDRLDPDQRAKAERAQAATAARIDQQRRRCQGTGPPIATPAPPRSLVSPRDGEAFTGTVVAATPDQAARATLLVDGLAQSSVTATKPSTVLRVTGTPRPLRHVEVRFTDSTGRYLSSAHAADLWLLPPTAWKAKAVTTRDRPLVGRLTALATTFPGYSAITISALASGRHAGWNENARFPAASTVKLGVAAAALARYRTPANRDTIRHELETICAWSSNLAANRLLALAGGQASVQTALHALGATSSSYTGAYRVGTAARPSSTEPPLVSQRVTTAADLDRTLTNLIRLAGGDRSLAIRTRLSPSDARLMIGLLLHSQKTTDNIGLFAPSLPSTLPLAQKNGWLSSARHTAAILFGPAGPVVAVLLTYAEPLSLTDAQRLGGSIGRIAAQTAIG